MNTYPFEFYVYAYLRKDGRPYYIGKGKEKRAWVKHKGYAETPKDFTQIVILEDGLSEVGALAIERRMIRWYGRKDNGTGILCNLTDGGDGLAGRIQSLEDRAKKSIAAKNRKNGSHSAETRLKMSISRTGLPQSDQKKLKISLRLKGQPKSAEHKEKIRQAILAKNQSKLM